MKRIATKSIPVFNIPRSVVGMSVYRSTIVLWDKDHDTRILTWIDRYGGGCLAVHEHGAQMTIVWDGPDDDRPSEYEVEDDYWLVYRHHEPN
jgi:hypothetical protein